MYHKWIRNIKRLQTRTTVLLPLQDMNPKINSIKEEGAVLHCSKISAIKLSYSRNVIRPYQDQTPTDWFRVGFWQKM